MSRFLLHIVGLLFLLNLVISAWNLVEDGLIWRRVIPAACWLVATILWYTVKVFRANASGSPGD